MEKLLLGQALAYLQVRTMGMLQAEGFQVSPVEYLMCVLL